MSRRAFRGGMIALICAVVMLLAGASPAAAEDGRLWSQAWSWIVSIWGFDDVGPEIDPNGHYGHLQTPPPPTPTVTTTTTEARSTTPRVLGQNHPVETRPGSRR